MDDITFLKKTLSLAKKGIGWVNPNPMVGAVVVKDGRVIGKGYHKKIGFSHAEIEALKRCKENPKGATLYVNLEPCTFFGKTPPCVDTIIQAGIKRVIVCTLDPNPKVNGTGKAILEENGILFETNFLENEARKLNEAFFTFHEKKRPYVAIKFATSLDGKVATREGNSKWITNQKARNFARTLRGQYQAILVGINTILSDDPNLGVRVKGKKDPLRIIIDPKLAVPLKSQVLRDANVLLMTTSKANPHKRQSLENKGFNVLVFNSEFIKISNLLSALYERGIISILVEGGGETLGNIIDSRLIDKVYAFQAPILIGGREAVSIAGEGNPTIQKAIRLNSVSYRRFDDNLLTIGYL